MSNLVLEIKQGEVMVVNGASIRFRTKTRIELTSRARFLFGKQLMALGDATTPARRLYFALQMAYVGNDEERGPAMMALRELVDQLGEAVASTKARAALGSVLESAAADRFYTGLKAARRLVRYEDAIAAGNPLADAELGDLM